MTPLDGILVVDFTRYLPGPFASRELLELGARVVRVLPPGGDPLQATDPDWHEELNAGKESVTVDLKGGRVACSRSHGAGGRRPRVVSSGRRVAARDRP